jgi:hypothetical protein
MLAFEFMPDGIALEKLSVFAPVLLQRHTRSNLGAFRRAVTRRPVRNEPAIAAVAAVQFRMVAQAKHFLARFGQATVVRVDLLVAGKQAPVTLVDQDDTLANALFETVMAAGQSPLRGGYRPYRCHATVNAPAPKAATKTANVVSVNSQSIA